jgi:SOS-response transcriptional repressor LexA
MVTSIEDVRAAFAERLNEALDDAGVPPKGHGRQGLVGKMFGMSQKGARKWLEGESLPDTRRIPQIAERLGVRGEWLLTGLGPKRLDDAHLREPGGPSQRPAGAPPASVRRVPVISYIQAGTPREVVDAYAEGDGFETLGIDPDLADRLGPHAFALRVEGESMVPDFRPGDYVLVDPDAPVRPGDIVVAKLDRDQSATLKKYRSRGQDAEGHPVFELVPLNLDYATVTVDASSPGRIIGPVVEHRRRLR